MAFDSLGKAWDRISDKVSGWWDSILDMLPNFFVALLVFLLFVLIAKIVGKVLTKRLYLVSKNPAVNGLIVSVAKIFIVAIGFLTCLGVMHLDQTVTSILAGLGIIGLAFSFAFQHTAHNLMSGIIIASKSTINVGHMVEINGVTGIVTRVGLRATYLDNTEGQTVAVPNRLVTDNNFKDYSSMGMRRIDLAGSVAFDTDLNFAKEIATKSIMSFSNIKEGKPVQFYYTLIGDFHIEFVIRYWIDFTNVHPEYLEAKSEGVIKIMESFKENNIEIPFPITTFIDKKG